MTSGSLAALAQRALKWSAVTTVARFVLQLGSQIALARMLGPENFGVYGIALTVLTFASFLSGTSFSWNLMLLPRVTDEDVRFSFTWQLIAGLLTACAMFAAAPAIAVFFDEPRVRAMVQLMSLACLLGAASAPATCLLQRDLNFRTLGLIQLASYAIGYLGVGVAMALAGYGAWSLGVACVVQAAVVLVAAYIARPHPVKPLLRHEGGAQALQTGRTVFFTNIVNWLLSNLDRVVIGRALSAQFVGLYSMAYNLASIPNQLLLGALQPAFLATGARLQDDPRRLGEGWLLGLACILVLATPVAFVAALLSADLVALLYGPAWADSAWVLSVLFLCLPAWACWGLSTPVLWNTGRRHQEYLLQLPLLAIAAPAWWYLAPAGIQGVAVISALVIYARAMVIIGAALAALQLRWTQVMPFVARGAVLAAACSLAVIAGQLAVSSVTVPGVGLVVGATCAVLTMLMVLLVRPALLGDQALIAISRVSPRLVSRLSAGMPVTAQGIDP
ncbi:oligosaccharide flippase family protein [Caenimonas sp. SL110]|uniref:oligosaccharide flippase family protein n=1 Tax=Caenimonas sp. SL110 TaxID=1450524 RepID=UPI000652BB66|nr:oligosaccharide flippase family protein [Caenimonas sp. SL110]